MLEKSNTFSILQNLDKNVKIIYSTLEDIVTFKFQAFPCDLVGISHVCDEVASFDDISNGI